MQCAALPATDKMTDAAGTTVMERYLHNHTQNITTKPTYSIMNLKPLADRVLIAPTAAEEVTMAGIIIPDSAKEKPLKGKVLAVGNGTKDEEMVLKAGDEVLYGKYAGTEIEFEGEKVLIMRQNEVLAVIEG